MPFKLRSPGGERTLDAALTMLWGGLLIWAGLPSGTSGTPGAAGGLNLAMGSLLLVAGVLLWFRMGWVRWPAVGLLGILALTQAWGLFSRGFGGGRLLALFALAWTAWDVFRHFSPRSLAESEPDPADERTKPMISLALLLRRPRYLDATAVARYCESAWGGTYRVLSEGGVPQPPGPTAAPGWVTGRAPFLLVGSPDGVFVVHNHDQPYFESSAELAAKTRDLRLRQVLLENRAWIAVDLMAPTEEGVPRETLYPPVARLIAALAGPDCQAIFRPETEEFNHWDEALEERLRGPDALSLFSDPTQLPVIEVSDEDPRMQAAVGEARSRWPEFVAAFESQSGEHFSIKAPVSGGGNTEFIWIDVDQLDGDVIRGRIGNAPVDLGALKEGSPVTVPMAEINDWVFLRKGQPHGLFTTKVLEAIRAEPRDASAG